MSRIFNYLKINNNNNNNNNNNKLEGNIERRYKKRGRNVLMDRVSDLNKKKYVL